jgi:hypothetical protein
MAHYICNHLRPWSKLANCGRALLIAAATLVCALPASAQSGGRTNSNSASAVLHINVFVVPTVMSAPKSAPLFSTSTVSYNVTTKTPLSTTQEVRAYSAEASAAGQHRSGLLMTITSVLR